MKLVMRWIVTRPIGLLGLLAITLVVALPILGYPMGRDQGMYANIGRTILNGGTPFVSMWDIKPPPIYYIYALGMRLFGETSAGIRAIDLVVVPLAMVGLYGLGQRLSNRVVGSLSAVIYAVFYLSDQFANLTQNDSIVTLPMIWAVVCAVWSLSAPRASRQAWVGAFLTGGLCGLVLWFKHYQAFFVVALVLHHLWIRRALPIKEALAFAVGGLVVGGGLLAYFWSIGVLQEMLIVAQGTSAYNAQYGDWGAFLAQMGNYFAFRWHYWGVLFLGAGAWLPLKLWFAPRQPQPDAPFSSTPLLILWFLAGLAFMVIQRLGFDTHWIPMLPPLAWMAGEALSIVIRALPIASWAKHALIAVSLVGLWLILFYNTWIPSWDYMNGRESQEAYFARFQANDLKPAQSLQVVTYLSDKLARGDTLYIWGFRPEVAFMGGWIPATRYQAQFPLVAPWYPHAWQQDNVNQLWAAMPKYVLIMQDDFMPWVTGQNADSHTILQGYTELNNWLMANYERIDTQGDFLIWQHQTAP